jgi:cell division protein FtsQ
MKIPAEMKKPPVALRTRLLHAAAALFVIAWLGAAAWYGYDKVLSAPIRHVVYAGPTGRIAQFDLETLARGIQSAPGRPSLAEIREGARRLRWVRDASARRISADTIEIRFETHEPLARWNDDALVSLRGEVFSAEYDGPLPGFRGGEGTAPLITRTYPAIANAVAPLGSPLLELRLSARGAWAATLASGFVLDLGRSDMEARIARLASVWPELQARAVPPTHIDLRYPNGFALQQAQSQPQPQSQPKKKKA